MGTRNNYHWTHPLPDIFSKDVYHANHKMKIGAFINVLKFSVQNNENAILPSFL